MNLTEKLTGVVRTVKASVRADNTVDKSEAVTVYLDIDYSDCTIEDLLTFSNSDRKIAWANGGNGRKAVGKLTKGQHIAVKATSPGAKAPEDPMDVLIARAKAAGRTIEEQFAFERAEYAKREK